MSIRIFLILVFSTHFTFAQKVITPRSSAMPQTSATLQASATPEASAKLQASATLQIPAPAIFVIKNVNVITMASQSKIIEHASVVVNGNIIQSINGPVPKNATVIDGTGKWMIPGFIDSHVHLPTDTYLRERAPTQAPDLSFNTQDLMTPFVANGVTTILDLNSTMQTFAQKKEIEKGYALGPRIALAALINGGDGKGRVANTAQEGRLLVKQAKQEGYDFIKVYSGLNIETYDAIIDEAYKQGMKTLGHIPDAFAGKIEQAFIPHFGLVAHAEEFSKKSDSFSVSDAQRFAKLAADNGTWLSPTLTAMVWIARQTSSVDSIKYAPALKYVHPLLQSKWLTANNYAKNASPESIIYFNKMVKYHFQLVKSFRDAGVPIIAGTDAGVSGVIAGFSLHDELELLVQAGLTTQEALNSATLLSAQWLGIDQKVGSIEIGKFADLILLDENPLTDIKNIRKISGVFVNGNWLDKKKLSRMLSDLARLNTANKDKFDWKKVMSNQN
ncbi:MAG: amidohydrolase [Chitinophagaceae bacterium]|nr:MAG: amidohydrolase [Chitinophagaceae bacterium]